MGRCKTCKFWKGDMSEPFGECRCKKFVYVPGDYNETIVPTDCVRYSYSDAYAYIEFGEDFGCIHYKKL